VLVILGVLYRISAKISGTFQPIAHRHRAAHRGRPALFGLI
jgi:hypothetical protein